MDTESKRQYMKTKQEEYLQAKSRKEKTAILNEYCKVTGEERKYAIKKLRNKVQVKAPEDRKRRGAIYDGLVKAALSEMWGIFDQPCGARLAPLLKDETDRLRTLGEIVCTDEVARKLKKIAPATIDRKLEHEKEVLRVKHKYGKKRDLTLLNAVPIKTSSDLNRKLPGRVQLDCVEHCGMSASGEYVNTLTSIDILFGWWEGGAFIGKGQERTLATINELRLVSPIPWAEMHPDNGSNLLNWHSYAYAKKHKIGLSRSRPYQKNDNCFVEQKNSTHVRKPFGYLRFDTVEELAIMQDLNRNELRLYKNFFQPVMKLTQKLRIKGRIHRKYDTPKTPYKRIMDSSLVDDETKKELSTIYNSLNPAELKRQIDLKIQKLYKVYSAKKGSRLVNESKKLTASLVSYQMMKQ